jgi:hypothetical protein
MRSGSRVLASLAVLVLSAACSGPNFAFGRKYVLDHDGQQLTVAVTTTVFDGRSLSPKNVLVVHNTGGKKLSLIAGVATGAEVNPSGEAFQHQYSQAQLNRVALRLNQRPRATLGFDTPADTFQACVASTG